MTLTEFLLARIAEDEAVARATADSYDPLDWSGDGWADAWHMHGPVDGPSGYLSLVVDPARVLAECKAHREIIESVDVLTSGEKSHAERLLYSDVEDARYQIVRDMLRHLAAVFADHPDYDEAWRP